MSNVFGLPFSLNPNADVMTVPSAEPCRNSPKSVTFWLDLGATRHIFDSLQLSSHFQQLKLTSKAMPERNGSATTMIWRACDDLLLYTPCCSQAGVALYWVTSIASPRSKTYAPERLASKIIAERGLKEQASRIEKLKT